MAPGTVKMTIRDIVLSYNSCGAYRTNFFTSVSNITPKWKEERDFSEAKHSKFLTSRWFFRLSDVLNEKRFLTAFHCSISAKIFPVSKRDISFMYVFYPPNYQT